MKKLKIGFTDTHDHLAAFFNHVLSMRYNVEIIKEDQPDFLIFGDRNFGNDNLNFDNPEGVGVEHGYCRVNEAATGMMLVKREVFTKMQEAYPDRKYESDQIINGQPFRSDNCYDLFSVGPYMTAGQKRYLSEDYYFSGLWQELGGEIWADVSMPLTHFGNRAFKGHVGALFAAKK